MEGVVKGSGEIYKPASKFQAQIQVLTPLTQVPKSQVEMGFRFPNLDFGCLQNTVGHVKGRSAWGGGNDSERSPKSPSQSVNFYFPILIGSPFLWARAKFWIIRLVPINCKSSSINVHCLAPISPDLLSEPHSGVSAPVTRCLRLRALNTCQSSVSSPYFHCIMTLYTLG